MFYILYCEPQACLQFDKVMTSTLSPSLTHQTYVLPTTYLQYFYFLDRTRGMRPCPRTFSTSSQLDFQEKQYTIKAANAVICGSTLFVISLDMKNKSQGQSWPQRRLVETYRSEEEFNNKLSSLLLTEHLT